MAESRTKSATRNGGRPCWRGADQVAGAAELKIDFGEFESVGGIDEGLQSLLGIVSRIVCKDTAVAGEDATADPAAHLMELGEAETVGAEDRHQRGVGNVDADFDDRRGDQNLRAAGGKFAEGGVFFFRGHAAVDEAQAEGFEFAVGEFFERGLQVGGVDVGGFFDERDDDIALAAFAEGGGGRSPTIFSRFSPSAR